MFSKDGENNRKGKGGGLRRGKNREVVHQQQPIISEKKNF